LRFPKILLGRSVISAKRTLQSAGSEFARTLSLEVPRQRLLSGSVPQHNVFVSHVANEQHSDAIRSLHTEKRLQAVGISTHAHENRTFSGSESKKSADNQVG
jgi:ethanolamine utilization microcompartment shell protein EutS